MFKVFGYGYVTKPTRNISRSTVYKALCRRFIPKENVHIDVLESDESRKQLNFILEHAETGDVILTLNRRTLGATKEFRFWWREIVLSHHLNLLIIDDSMPNGVDDYSTIDFSFEPFSADEINEKYKKLQTDVFERQTRQIGRKPFCLSKVFESVYWAYQSFFISVSEAYEYLGVSRQTFYNMCKEYENTEKYSLALSEHPELFKLPRRGGISPEIVKLLFLMQGGGMTLSEACKKLDIRELSPEEYQRYFLAKEGGRTFQFEAEKRDHIQDYFRMEKEDRPALLLEIEKRDHIQDYQTADRLLAYSKALKNFYTKK